MAASRTRPKKTDLDPRPDLVADHRMWVAVLALTWLKYPDLHGLLHGIRCAGGTLTRLKDGRYKLELGTVSGWTREELVPYLAPWRDTLVVVFRQAPNFEAQAEATLRDMARKAG